MADTKISQDIIRLYDAFTHGTMSRRAFMAKLTVLTGSAAAASACVPTLQNNYAAEGAMSASEAMADYKSTVTYQADVPVSGTMFTPETKGPWPAVMVIHENRGLNPHIEDVAARVAQAGFLAFAPNMLSPYGGTPASQDEARDMIYQIETETATNRLFAGLEYLRTTEGATGKVGAVGFCWGGGQVNRLAVRDPNLDAAVAYYGSQADAADVPQIEAPLMLHYAGLDDRINAGIEAYEDALEAAGKDYTIHMYEGVNHAFNNDANAARYDAEAAALAWQRTIDFFKEHLA
ncbi:dienelactone hydrolase family protein [Parvularcula flava]|uniref:Carboxymethylenebutenolidase n=1 Tax=Aquisalinus luteolus TaxID=1566827 RepID=A0A8J3A550_9PROT|nr:dienelactone hydrolase family protein [Aquisalinus luteolus]NHK28646.1 dienelactone hydrolase family protein [Aquisalinus luteolus]GGH99101.1 carboxymethylenebutenolidase [Aquisalinus luteolus]